MTFAPRYEPQQTALIRVAAQPVESLLPRLVRECSYSDLDMDGDFFEAIASASPSLANAILRARTSKISANEHAKLVDAVWNYRLRATTRPAPLGLLAGVAAIPVKKKGCLIDLSAKFKKNTRGDPRIHWDEAGRQARNDPNRGAWTVNPSVYIHADTLRYLAFPLDSIAAIHTVSVSPAVADAIVQFRTPLSLVAMTSKLMSVCSLSSCDARNVLLALAQNGFLTSSDQRAVTHAALATNKGEIEDLVLDHRNIALSQETAARVARATELVGAFTPPGHDTLALLCAAIEKRWGRQRVPLMQLFDPETGLTVEGQPARMLGDFLVHTSSHEAPYSGDEADLATVAFVNARKKILTPLLNQGDRVIDLSQFDTSCLPPHGQEQWPTSLAGIFTIAQEESKNMIWFETAAGPDSARLTARFGAIDPAIGTALLGSDVAPDNADPYTVHCEVFIPPFFTGAATLTRLNPYGKVIACDGSPDPTRDIRLADLAVQVLDGHILLIETQHNRRVIPHFSHPVRLDIAGSPPHLRFLARMATIPRFRSLRWEWSDDEIRPFMPRIACHGVVVSPARWTLYRTDFASPDLSSVRQRLCELGVPALFKLVTEQGTPFTLIMSVDACLRTLITALNQKPRVTLQECPGLAESTVRLPGGNYVSDFVLPLRETRAICNRASFSTDLNTNDGPPTVRQRNDLDKSEWHSLHLPCLETRTDSLLIDIIDPLISGLRARHWLREWHFVRETDESGEHLRLRLLPQTEPGVAQCVIQYVGDALAAAECTRLIGTPIQHSFVPEIHRYGGSAMIESVIRYFTNNSNFSIDWLKRNAKPGDRVRIIEHTLMAVRILGRGVTLSCALARCKALQQRVAADLISGVDARRLSGRIFRDEKAREGSALKMLLDAQKNASGNAGYHFFSPDIHSYGLQAIPRHTSDDILFSIIHMNGNRLFRHAQRSHESVAYELASRILISMLAMNEQRPRTSKRRPNRASP